MIDPHTAARLIALARIAAGGALLVAPEATLRPWIGRDAASPGAQVLGAALGVRDLVIGAGTLSALVRGHGARTWVRAGAAADLVDLAATLRARDRLPASGVALVGLMATTGAVAGAWVQTAVR